MALLVVMESDSKPRNGDACSHELGHERTFWSRAPHEMFNIEIFKILFSVNLRIYLNSEENIFWTILWLALNIFFIQCIYDVIYTYNHA